MAVGIAAKGFSQQVPPGLKGIAATLHLFDLCGPAGDQTVAHGGLAKVLETSLGGKEEVASVLGHLDRGIPGDGSKDIADERVDFLSYWQAMDNFLAERGSQPSSLAGTVRGMQSFRDGVLEIARRQLMAEPISSQELLALLRKIRATAEDPSYWDEVMEAVPSEEGFGLSLREVAEAVYVWLRDFLQSEVEEDDTLPFDLDEKSAVKSSGHVFVDSPTSPLSFAQMSPVSAASTVNRDKRFAWRPYDRGSCRGTKFGTDQDHETLDSLTSGVQKAVELFDVLSRGLGPQDTAAHQALSRLKTVHRRLERDAQRQEAETRSVRERNQVLEKRQKTLDVQIEELSEAQHEFERMMRQRDEEKSRADGLQRKAFENKELYEAANLELKRVKEEYQNHETTEAELQSRESQYKAKIHELQESLDRAEGQVQWLYSEIEKVKEQAATEVEKAQGLSSSVARANAENEAMKELLDRKGSENATATAALNRSLAELRDREQELTNLRAKSAQAEAQLREKDQEIGAREQELRTLTIKMEAIQEDLELAESLKREAEQKHQTTVDRLAAAPDCSEIDELKRKNEERASQLAEAQRKLFELDKFRRKCDEQGNHLAEHQQKLEQRDEKIRRLIAAASEQAKSVSDTKLLEEQLHAQQMEIERLRSTRDDMVSASVAEDDAPIDVAELNPEKLQLHRKNVLLQRMMKDLLTHSQELERMLDDARRDPYSPASSSDARKRLSIQRIADEWSSAFNENVEQLYTMEVQKEDVEKEVGILSRKVSSQEKEIARLRQVEKHRDGLLLELRSSKSHTDSRSSTTLADGQVCDRSAASDTSSALGDAAVASSTQKSVGSRASSEFFLGGIPVHGALKMSPKKMSKCLELDVRSERRSSDGSPQTSEKVARMPGRSRGKSLSKGGSFAAERRRSKSQSRRQREKYEDSSSNEILESRSRRSGKSGRARRRSKSKSRYDREEESEDDEGPKEGKGWGIAQGLAMATFVAQKMYEATAEEDETPHTSRRYRSDDDDRHGGRHRSAHRNSSSKGHKEKKGRKDRWKDDGTAHSRKGSRV
mmetsp:Transcript_20579/g.57192  ORF Transcript_20579/g.57192 Transcript_20579/m.57192 type:complete len:1060 (+) Transcript_20579:51-3230(+)